MTKEQQRIAIAEACGWNIIEVIEGMPFGILDSHTDKSPRLVPDYLNDLNAIQEASLLRLNKLGLRSSFQTHLLDTVRRDNPHRSLGQIYFLCVNATARQRAEAFLRTLKLWIE